jgi:hypothetical protein
VRAEQGQVGRRPPVARGLGLVPERVEQRRRARLIEAPALLVGEDQIGGGQVVGQLLVGAGADDQRGR